MKVYDAVHWLGLNPEVLMHLRAQRTLKFQLFLAQTGIQDIIRRYHMDDADQLLMAMCFETGFMDGLEWGTLGNIPVSAGEGERKAP